MADNKQSNGLSLVPKYIWFILGAVALLPIVLYIIAACFGWLVSAEWANAGTFISCFAVIALTSLNIYAMFAINDTLQNKQQDQYKESRSLELFKVKLQIMNEFVDAYRNAHEELAKGKTNTEVLIVNMNKIYQLDTIISKTEGLFPSLKDAHDVSHMNELLSGFANALAGVYVPINRNTQKAYTPQELIDDLKRYYDGILIGISDDISKEMNKTK